MRGFLAVCTLLGSLFICVHSRPSERLFKDEKFDMTHFLRKSRFAFKNVDKTDNPPHLKIKRSPDKVIQLLEGQTLSLECEAAGNPPPKVYWLKDGERIEKALDNSEDLVDSPQQLGLSMTRGKYEVSCADLSDGGVYACVADNGYSRLVVESVVKISKAKPLQQLCLQKRFALSLPVNIVMHTNTRLEYIGQSAQLYCRASGSNVRYTWTAPEQREVIQNSPKFLLLESGDLIIRNLTWEDMGGYTCEASNGVMSDRISTFLYPTLPETN